MKSDTKSLDQVDEPHVDTSITVNVVARRNGLGGFSYRTEEIAYSEREAVSVAAFGAPAPVVDNKAFPVVGIYTLRITTTGFRSLTPGEANIIGGA